MNEDLLFDTACDNYLSTGNSKVANFLTREIAKCPQIACEALGKVADITPVYQPKRISAILD